MSSKRRLHRKVRELPIPSPWSVEAFLDALSQTRGRPIHLIEQPGRGSVTGSVWVFEDADVISVRSDLRGTHRDHVICHEVGHLLANHRDEHPEDFGLPTAAHHMFNRECGHSDAQEQEAEFIAEQILDRAARHSTTGYESVF